MVSDVAGLTALVTALISFLFMLFPAARDWYFSLPVEYQTAAKGGLALLVGVVLILLTCAGVVPLIPIKTCDATNVLDFVLNVIVATILGFGGASFVAAFPAYNRTRKARAAARANKGV